MNFLIDEVEVEQHSLNGAGEPVEQGFRVIEPEAGIGDALTVSYRCILTPGDQVALEHQSTNGRSTQVLHDRVRNVDLTGRILVTVAVAAVHHEDLGESGGTKQANGASDGGGRGVGTGLAP